MYQHEAWAHTEATCEEIARDYPHTPTAPYALYRAGCCAAKLAHFNGWWRDDDARHGHYREAARLMTRLYRRYPKCPLAHEARKFAGVFWESATHSADDWRSDGDENSFRIRNEGL